MINATERRLRFAWIGLLVAAVGGSYWWNTLSEFEKCDAQSLYITALQSAECNSKVLAAKNLAQAQADLEAAVDQAEAELNAALAEH